MTGNEIDTEFLRPEWIGPASHWQANAPVVGLDCVRAAVKAALSHQAKTTHDSFQQRVEPWLLACFGEQIAADTIERNHRFLEEALELVQACGCTQSEAHQLVDYVFGRPVGEVQQEAGGVMVTLAALCRSQGISMHEAGETELARIWTKVEAIRAKQAAKPKHSPLPGPAAALAQQAVPEGAVLVNRETREGVMFYSADMLPDLGTIKDRFELVKVFTHPAPAAPQAEQQAVRPDKEWQRNTVKLTAAQLAEALEFVAPDYFVDDEQHEHEVCIAWAPDGTVPHDEGGFEPAGYVVWLAEYPEEGCMPLDGQNPTPHRRAPFAPAALATQQAEQREQDLLEANQSLRDMLDDARAELAAVREALGVPHEPHQSLQERTLLAAQQAEREPQWRPIVTAPKDGTCILAWRRDLSIPVIAYYAYGKWGGASGYVFRDQPTHWMPLPGAHGIGKEGS